MDSLRWLLLVAFAPGLVALHIALFLIGDEAGLKDTPAVRFAFVGTALLSVLIGWACARWLPVRYTAWSLPIGVGLAMSVWLPVRRPTALTLVVFAVVVLTWVCVLTVASVVVRAISRRRRPAAVLFAAVATVILVALAPLFAAVVGVGPSVATPDSLGTWLPTVLSDNYWVLAAEPRQASEIASMVAVLVMTGTCFVLAYVSSLRTHIVGTGIVVVPRILDRRWIRYARDKG